VGSYRNVPFESLWELKYKNKHKPDDYKTNKEHLVKLFNDCNCAFIDLIPFPLPEIHTQLRKTWLKRNKTSFIVDLFINAVNNIKQFRDISDKVKIIFMMPPTTAAGIINYCITNYHNPMADFLIKHKDSIIRCNDNSIFFSSPELFNYTSKLHRQIVMGGAGGPIKELFTNALK
jgi:hypothetical protein